MLYSEDRSEIRDWVPLMMNGREDNEPIAVTRMEVGTDVNFGMSTRSMIAHLQNTEGVELHLGHEVRDLTKSRIGHWTVQVKDLATRSSKEFPAKFVFIGADGGSMSLLEKSDIPEGRGYGGFPVSS